MSMIEDVTVCIYSNLSRPGKLVISRSAHERLREEIRKSGFDLENKDLQQIHGVKVEIRPDDAVFFIEQEKSR